ncbi:MAG: CDP-alcohol phosphatidyltransferase family protein [Chitinophagaceae bacterium]|nr:CDP-alcohol phosphatidyltransferase family protein [Chitinophagaceae bacterium]
MKQFPNFLTLLNLVFGCIAIILILQTGETIVQLDPSGISQVFLPEKIWWGALFIFAAAAVDFLDGFIAKVLKASSELGRQLDSLSDVVSFGVAPGMILYQLLRISYAKQQNGLDVSFMALLPAFVFTCAVAWRLAKFNISDDQTNIFKGVPSPAAALVVASFPLIILYEYYGVQFYLINRWVLYVSVLLLSFLMLTNRSFISFKFQDFSIGNNLFRYILIAVSLICIIIFKWLAVPLIFTLYILLSFFLIKNDSSAVFKQEREITDVTV